MAMVAPSPPPPTRRVAGQTRVFLLCHGAKPPLCSPLPGESTTVVSRVGRLVVGADDRDAVAEVLDGIREAADLDPELRRRLALAGLLVPEDVREA